MSTSPICHKERGNSYHYLAPFRSWKLGGECWCHVDDLVEGGGKDLEGGVGIGVICQIEGVCDYWDQGRDGWV